MLAKLDIKSAYRIVLVHPEDRPLPAMRWRNRIFIDKTLPFGLRSAPIIFSTVVDAIQWIVRQKGVTLISHYLDDFTILGKAGTTECAASMSQLKETCTDLGVPITLDKREGPAMCLTILGIQIL